MSHFALRFPFPMRPASLLPALLCTLLPCARAAEPGPQAEPAVQAVQKVLPAVVNINTERTVQKGPYEQGIEQYYGSGKNRGLTARATVQSLGSGFLVNADGYIVTNEHVVERAADLKIWVTLSNKQTYQARYITGSQQADLAFIKIDVPEPLPFISLDDLSPSLLGQTVLVLGNPLGFGSSVARGILSGKDRTVTMERATYKNLLQTDAAINPGNSGGPVIDLAGKLVGVSSVKMTQTKQGIPTQGMGFAIEADTVRQKVGAFMRVVQGLPPVAPTGAQASFSCKFIGVQLEDLTAEQGCAFNPSAKSGIPL